LIAVVYITVGSLEHGKTERLFFIGVYDCGYGVEKLFCRKLEIDGAVKEVSSADFDMMVIDVKYITRKKDTCVVVTKS